MTILYLHLTSLDGTPDDSLPVSRELKSCGSICSIKKILHFKRHFPRLWRYRHIPSVRIGIYLRLQEKSLPVKQDRL